MWQRRAIRSRFMRLALCAGVPGAWLFQLQGCDVIDEDIIFRAGLSLGSEVVVFALENFLRAF